MFIKVTLLFLARIVFPFFPVRQFKRWKDEVRFF